MKIIFDPFASEFKATPSLDKILILKELFYCGLQPVLINSLYKKYCIDSSNDDLFEDLGLALLNICSDIHNIDLTQLDNNVPSLWFDKKLECRNNVEEFEVVIDSVQQASESFQKRLLDEAELVMRTRLIFLDYSSQNPGTKIINNKNKFSDDVVNDILAEFDTFETNDLKKRTFQVEDFAADSLEKHDTAYKEYMETSAENLIQYIENMDIDNLVKTNMFFGNLENILNAKKNPKKWLYETVCKNRQMYRALKKVKDDIPFQWSY